MVETRSDPFNFGEPADGGVGADAMRHRIASSLFGDAGATVRVGRFELIEEIGAGGMGVVHRAYDPKLSRDVAIKLVKPHRSGVANRSRLVREAQMLARLNHPNVVAVYESGEDNEQVFLVMEFVAGVNARDWVAERSPGRQDVLSVYLQAGRGLVAAHAAGLVHRDFKPSNVLLGDDGRVRVADFGLADTSRSAESSSVDGSETDDETRHPKKRGAGTPAYMAPEQWAGSTATMASDQFSFSVALWEALSGVRPFSDAASAGLGADVGALRGAAAISARLRGVLRRGLSADPLDRWPSLAEMLDQLEPMRTPRWFAGAVAIGASVVAAAGAFVLTQRRTDADQERASSPCELERDRFASTWSPPARVRIGGAFVQAVPYGAAMWPSLESALDDHSERWLAVADTVCETNDTTGLACLRRGAARRAQVLAAVESANPVMAAHLHGALAQLADPRRCVSPGAERFFPVPSGDPKLDADVTELRSMLASADTLGALGDVEGAQRLVERAEALVDVNLFPPVGVDIECARATLAERTGDNVAGVEHFRACMLAAIETEHDALVVPALAGLIRTAAWTDTEDDRIEEWHGLASASLGRIGQDDALARLVDEAMVVHARMRHRWAEATTLAERLLAGAPNPERALWARRQLASIRLQSGQRQAARRDYEAILAEQRARLGARHPDIGTTLLALGRTHEDAGRAAPIVRQSVDLFANSLGRDSVKFARAATVLALNLAMLGDVDEARALAEEASNVQLARLGRNDAERTSALSLRVELEQALGNLEGALRLGEQLLDELEPGTDRGAYLLALNKMGIVSLDLRQPARAEAFFARLRGATSSDDPMHWYALSGASRAHAAQGSCRRALELAERVDALVDDGRRGEETELLGELAEVRLECEGQPSEQQR